MMNAIRRICTSGAIFSLAVFASSASAQNPPTAFQKQLSRIDLGVSGSGYFTPNNSGTSYLPQLVGVIPSSTLGATVELRYIASRWVGFEYNYGYARYVDDFTVTNTTGSPRNASSFVLGVQSKVTEFTVGYIAHPRVIYGLQTFVGGGGGAIAFRPTPGGGQGVPPVFRGAAYYTVGVEKDVYGEHFGLRAQFRQVFFGSPDYNQNYLATGTRSATAEPSVGFYLRF